MTKPKRGRPFEEPAKFAMPTDLLGYNIVRLAHLKRTRDDALFKSHLGIGLIQFGSLMMLRDSPGLGGGQLARWLWITPQSTAVLLAELERLQLVKRETGRRRRGARIKLHITQRGMAIIERGQTALAQAEAEVRIGLSAMEAQTLNRLLLRVAEGYTDLHRASKRLESSQGMLDPPCHKTCQPAAAVRKLPKRRKRKPSISSASGRGSAGVR